MGQEMNRKANSLMEKIQFCMEISVFLVNQGNTYSAAEGKHGFSNLSPCWGRGLRASLAR